VRKTAIYFFGLAILIAGIFILNAQEKGDDESSPAAQSNAVEVKEVKEVSAEMSSAVETAQTAAVTVSEANTNQTQTAAEQALTPSPSAETNAPAAKPQVDHAKGVAETNKDQPKEESSAASKDGKETSGAVVVSVETNVAVAQPQVAVKEAMPEPSKTETSVESKNGKEPSKGEKAAAFDIDRGDKTAKEIKASETGETAPAVKEQPAEEKSIAQGESGFRAKPGMTNEAAVQKPGEKKQKRNGFFGRLFGSGKEEGKEGAESKAGQKEEKASVAKDQGGAGSKGMSPEELLAAQEEVRRQAKEVEGLKKLDQAYQEMGRKEFDKALTHFSEALSVMPLRPHTVETRQKAMMSEAECEYRLALNNYQGGKVKEAREDIRRALEYSPGHRGAARLSERIKQDELRRERVEAEPVPPRKSPAYLDKQKTIKGELQRGREYMAIKEYAKAENAFKSVLADDKLNSEASANLKKIAETSYILETDEFQRMKAEMLAQIRDTWTPPVKKVATGPRSEAQETIIASQARRRLEDKLKNIMIPEIKFENATIEGVVTYLHQQSLAGDRDSAPGEKGVNILLRLNSPSQSAAPAATTAAADVFAADETKPAGGDAGSGSVPAITMTMRNISLMDAIKYITDIAGLKYRIEERVVIIHRSDIALGELETRTYKVLPSTIEVMTGGAGASLTTTEAGGDKMEIGQKATVSTERTDIKKFLNDAGVPFPENTSIVYIPAPPLLIVKNTSENLESFERLLNKLNVPTVQVSIEARFVEIGQTDLEELGLEWLLTDNWEIATKPNGERIQMNKNNLTKGLRELNVAGGQVGTAVGGTMGSIASISSILTNPELTVVLHALQQSSGVNLLSAPKVTTKSGSNAKIKVVDELIYPTEYQQQAQSIGTTSAGNQSLVQIVVTPSAFETRDTGVILDVTPTVGPDNETIDLVMLPQVVELARWIDYGSDVPTGDANRTQHLTLNQPVFHCRDITTSISIWDGQTVVMGGLISEGQQNTEDKVPFLGDIPLLGYLFRSTTTKSVKNNLLIFVTATLVDPAGNKIKKDSETSLAAESGTAAATP